jgi:hypothetical protein
MRNMMYAILATLLAFGTANAADSSSSVRIDATDWFVSYDQSGANRTDADEFRIGNGNLSVYADSDTDIGLHASTGGPAGFSLWAEYADNKDYVIGAGADVTLGSFSLIPRMNWNIDESAWDTDVKGVVNVFDIDLYARLWWDWEADDVFQGTNAGLGWTITMAPNLSMRPYWEMPFDSDWESGKSIAGVNVNVSF